MQRRIPGAAPALQAVAKAGFQLSDVRTREAKKAVEDGLNSGTLKIVQVGRPPQIWLLPVIPEQ